MIKKTNTRLEISNSDDDKYEIIDFTSYEDNLVVSIWNGNNTKKSSFTLDEFDIRQLKKLIGKVQ